MEIYLPSGEQIPVKCKSLDRNTIQVEFPEKDVPDSLRLRILDGEDILFDNNLDGIRGGDIFELKSWQ